MIRDYIDSKVVNSQPKLSFVNASNGMSSFLIKRERKSTESETDLLLFNDPSDCVV